MIKDIIAWWETRRWRIVQSRHENLRKLFKYLDGVGRQVYREVLMETGDPVYAFGYMVKTNLEILVRLSFPPYSWIIAKIKNDYEKHLQRRLYYFIRNNMC